MLIIFPAGTGEITTNARVDYTKVARDTIRDIGYTRAKFGFDSETCSVLSALDRQSPDIAMGVDTGGAGDQGLMFGFACNETPELMPAPISFAHKLGRELTRLRKKGEIPWLRPDAKTQVSIESHGHKPVRASAIVVSTQHAADVKQKEIRETLIELLIKKVIPAEWLDEKTTYLINPTGRFVVGGPEGDAGITGRKIIVDSYGGMGRHGGGAFSGKDPSKVDRSAAYMGRWVAKNVVASGLADRCEVQFAYSIGHPEPVSVSIDTFCTGKVGDEKLERAVCEVFNFKPAEIPEALRKKMEAAL